MLGKLTPLLAEIDWVELIVYCGLTAAVLTVGIYLILAVRDWMATPADYDSVGDHLDSLRQALELGSMDPDEYRKAVQALQSQAETQCTGSGTPGVGRSGGSVAAVEATAGTRSCGKPRGARNGTAGSTRATCDNRSGPGEVG